jgi:hypothetical protein
MAKTYEPISTTTLGTTAASVTFSSIPATYTDLVVVVVGSITSGNENFLVQFNSDTASNYSDTSIGGNGTTAISNRETSNTAIRCNSYGSITTNLSQYNISIMNYANTTTYKTTLSRGNNTGTGTSANVGLWRSTAAINAVKLLPSASTFTSGSTFTLYGIKSF